MTLFIQWTLIQVIFPNAESPGPLNKLSELKKKIVRREIFLSEPLTLSATPRIFLYGKLYNDLRSAIKRNEITMKEILPKNF